MIKLIGDFETYYSTDFSLSKMPTELYVRDKQFETIGFSYNIEGQSGWLIGKDEIANFLNQFDWSQVHFVAHNARFDSLVLAHHFNKYPAFVSCTMSMAAAAGLASLGRLTLDNVGATLREAGCGNIPPKGKTVELAKGKHLCDMDMGFLRDYGKYSATDVTICGAIYDVLSKFLPWDEVRWESMVLKSGFEPRMQMNKEVLLQERERIITSENNALLSVANVLHLNGEKEELLAKVRSYLRSKDKLYQVLDAIGGVIDRKYWLEPAGENTTVAERQTGKTLDQYVKEKAGKARFVIPMKVSEPKTKKNGYPTLEVACAKTDKEFTALADNDDPIISTVASARLSAASSISLTRCDRFLDLAKLGVFSVPINISGAHTHRMSGADKLNVQNLPTGRKAGQTNALRVAMEAPDGWVYVAGDASQIEARLNAYESQELAMIETFATGGDPYSVMAGNIYNRDPNEIKMGNKTGDPVAKEQRQLGKASVLGAGYRMGWQRFKESARESYGLNLTEEMAQHTIQVYRKTNVHIVQMWKFLDHLLELLVEPHNQGAFGGKNNNLFYYDSDYKLFGKRTPGIRLPDGLWVIYPNLRFETVVDEYNGGYKLQPICDRFKGNHWETTMLHGGKILENITQALAFCVGKWQSNILAKHYPFVMNEHDAWVFMVPENEAEKATELLINTLKINPPWLDTQCVLNCEAGYHKSYGSIKK